MEKAFKICPNCSYRWNSMTDFIRDRNLELNGYQASFNDTHDGLFMVTHNMAGCGTTLAIPAKSLTSLYDGPEHMIHMAFTDRCDGHCMYEKDYAPCFKECDMKWARDILQILRDHGPESLLKKLEAANTRHIGVAV